MYKLIFIFILFISFLGCKKVKENFLIKGDWEVKSIYMNGGSLNMMELALPYYKEGKGIYYCYFYDEGLTKGEYFTHDTLNYEVFGEWEIKKNKVFMKMDAYINGEFEYQRSGKKEYTLFCDSNYVELYDMGYVELLIVIKKL